MMAIRMDTTMHGGRHSVLLLMLLAVLALTSSALGSQHAGGGLPADLEEAVRLCGETSGADRADAEAWRDALQAAVHAGEDPALLVELLRRGQEEGLAREEFGEILLRVKRLADLDVPIELVVDRILQGIAKGVTFSRIEAVAEHLEQNLVEAANAVDENFPPAAPDTLREERRALVNHAVYALNAGASPSDLGWSLSFASAAEASMEDAGALAIALGCLLSAGLEPAQSLQFVETAWEHGYRGPVMIELGKAVAMFGHPESPPPEQLVEGLLHQIRRQAKAGDIFQDLEKAHAAGDFHPSDVDPTGVAAPDPGAGRAFDGGNDRYGPEDPGDPEDGENSGSPPP
jgi:hypothetical protein